MFLTRDRDEWTAELSPADTCVAPVLSVPEVVDDAQFVARGDFVDAKHPDATARSARSVRCSRGWRRPPEPYEVRDATVTDTDELLRAAGVSRRRVRRAPRGRSDRVTEHRQRTSSRPTSTAVIDVLQYEEEADFPVERGYFWNYCSSAENGNPLFWDDDVAAELTGGPVAPPSMLSAWFRPHHWAPGARSRRCRCRCTST